MKLIMIGQILIVVSYYCNNYFLSLYSVKQVLHLTITCNLLFCPSLVCETTLLSLAAW